MALISEVAGAATGHALLSCVAREMCGPEGGVSVDGRHLVVALSRQERRLRARLRDGCGLGPCYRFAGPVEELGPGGWRAVGWERLAALVAGELRLATGVANPELTGQVAASHAAIAALQHARAARLAPIDDYVDSEQALIAGHRYHPAPKCRQGAPTIGVAYAPEARAAFGLRLLAVRADQVAEEHAGGPGGAAALDLLDRVAPAVPAGYRALPAHPWQLALLRDHPPLRAALRDGRVIDLGTAGRPVVATASVRTVYDPAADAFCKFSLDVRITNCVRKHAWYELEGAVALTRLLRPVFADVGAVCPGAVLLEEPAYRTVALDDLRLREGLAVVVREGVRGRAVPGTTPLLAAAIADEHAASRAAVATLLARGDGSADAALAWWRAYVERVAPPVLHALAAHGVVLEAHLQNVVVSVDRHGVPVQAIFRDLEGVKLTGEQHSAALAGLHPRVREALTYDAGRAWDRVLYCLVVNHLAEAAAAVACARPGLERDLWRVAGDVLRGVGRALDWPPRLRSVLVGAPLPAKANLRARWARVGDRHATYVPVANPLAGLVAPEEVDGVEVAAAMRA